MAKRAPDRIATEKAKSKVTRAFSAGGAVYKKAGEKGKLLWLLIKPTGSDSWRLPKGIIGETESSQKAALREIFEETGVKAKILSKIGVDRFFFNLKGERILKFVSYFLMEFVEGAGKPSWEVKEVAWFPYRQAFELLTYKGEKEILRQAREALMQPRQEI